MGRGHKEHSSEGPLVAAPGHFFPVPVRPVFGPRTEDGLQPAGNEEPLAPVPSGSGPELENVPVPRSLGRTSRTGKRPAARPIQPVSAATRCEACQ